MRWPSKIGSGGEANNAVNTYAIQRDKSGSKSKQCSTDGQMVIIVA